MSRRKPESVSLLIIPLPGEHKEITREPPKQKQTKEEEAKNKSKKQSTAGDQSNQVEIPERANNADELR